MSHLYHKFDQLRLAVGDTLLLEGQPKRLKRLFDRQELINNFSAPHERPLRQDKAAIAVTAIGLVMGQAAWDQLRCALPRLPGDVAVD